MYDNAGYQNTGNQKSGATPRGAKTTTTPNGKPSRPKDIALMMIAQGVPYVATANASYPQDLFDKISRAATEFKGQFRFIQIFSPCPPGWNIDTRDTVKIGELANKTGFWSLYEAVDGKLSFSRPSRRFNDPEKRESLDEFLQLQGRFKGIDRELITLMQDDIELRWNLLRKFAE